MLHQWRQLASSGLENWQKRNVGNTNLSKTTTQRVTSTHIVALLLHELLVASGMQHAVFLVLYPRLEARADARSGEQSQIRLAYSPKVVRTNEIVKFIIIT